MPQFMRRSLLAQLVSIYLLFVITVLGMGAGVNAAIERQLTDDVAASDQALAQEIALDTSSRLRASEKAVVTLSELAQRSATLDQMSSTFQAFLAGRQDVEHVYWLDSVGRVKLSVKSAIQPPELVNDTIFFSPGSVVEHALTASAPVFEVGIAEETTTTASVIIANPVRDNASGSLLGIAVISVSLDELSAQLEPVVTAQQQAGKILQINIIDNEGVAVASSEPKNMLSNLMRTLPGAKQALNGNPPATQPGTEPDGGEWLYSAVPITDFGWAVVVQRPASQALDIVGQLHLWLFATALLFAGGVGAFWLLLLNRVIRPLHALSRVHHLFPTQEQVNVGSHLPLSAREDEVGMLAQSLDRLEHDVRAQLGELHTLLETSSEVVRSLQPRAVVRTIIREVQRLVDVQAAAVLVPDDDGVLKVIASEGHSERYDRELSLSPENTSSVAVKALSNEEPVQHLLGADGTTASLSYAEGFRVALAVPLISQQAGRGILLVHRTEPKPFTPSEVDLVLTFANHATLAWEHAVVYEQSDEQVRQTAAENARLYRLTHEEKRRLEATMSSMSDGLVIAGADGHVLYANPGAAALTGLSPDVLKEGTMTVVHEAMQAMARDSEGYAQSVELAEAGERLNWLMESDIGGIHRAIALRIFAVRGEGETAIGRGLLLRDVTLEHKADEFKTTLLAAVGHELRTPLTAIKGHASTLLQNDVSWSAEEQHHSLRTISEETDRLADLVRDLLDLSRQQAGMLMLHREPWKLENLIESAINRVGQSPGSIAVDIPQDLPLVEVDRARTEVVLRNLLANAVAYGGDLVRVSARARDKQVEVAVSDNGAAIDPEELAHLFERFYRASRGMQRHAQGTGLGLAICKAFVEAHGGGIRAESGPTGTCIRFTLPAHQDAVAPLIEELTQA